MRLNQAFTAFCLSAMCLNSMASYAALEEGIEPSKGNVLSVTPSVDRTDEQSITYEISPGQVITLPANIVVYEQEEFRNHKSPTVLEKGDRLTVLPATEESTKLGLVRIGVGVSDVSQEPSLILVPAGAIPQERLIEISETQLAQEQSESAATDDNDMPIMDLMAGADLDQDDQDAFGLEEARYGNWSFRHSRGGGHKKKKGMTYCLRNVRKMMCARGICCSNSFGGVAAYAIPSMLKQCKGKVHGANISSHKSLKVGSVCCVRGGYHKCGKGMCGDCVMKIGQNAWTNKYGVRASPLGSRYTGGSCAARR